MDPNLRLLLAAVVAGALAWGLIAHPPTVVIWEWGVADTGRWDHLEVSTDIFFNSKPPGPVHSLCHFQVRW